MTLPVRPPIAPMLARLVPEIPRAEGLYYEPKWDGFRSIVFRDGDSVELASRNERPLTRYFPELLDPLRESLPDPCVLDGEVVVLTESGLDFDALSERIHPAASRIARLAAETPASFVAFDLLAMGDRDLTREPFAERRRLLESVLKTSKPPIYLTPTTKDPAVAEAWFHEFEGAGFDGIVAKPAEIFYEQDRRVMYKVKHQRTADCVVGGFRWYRGGEGVGSLLLGLYDRAGALSHVGVASGFSAANRAALVERLAPYRLADPDPHPWRNGAQASSRVPGGPSRWSRGKDLTFEALRPELVCEVAYDYLQGDRFRHATSLVRWREDRDPRSCTYDQLERPSTVPVSRVFGPPEGARLPGGGQ